MVGVSDQDQFELGVASLAVLADPQRRALYRAVGSSSRPIGRDEAAAAVGMPLHRAKFHLDRMVEAGLLEVEYRRLNQRAGPGAGRPAKLYRRASHQLSVSLPARQYELAAGLLAAAVDQATRGELTLADALANTATQVGRSLGEDLSADAGSVRSRRARSEYACASLQRLGYEPTDEGASISMGNCPFHNLAQRHPDLVCGMNLDLLNGLVEGLAVRGLRLRLDPAPGRCCVRIDLD